MPDVIATAANWTEFNQWTIDTGNRDLVPADQRDICELTGDVGDYVTPGNIGTNHSGTITTLNNRIVRAAAGNEYDIVTETGAAFTSAAHRVFLCREPYIEWHNVAFEYTGTGSREAYRGNPDLGYQILNGCVGYVRVTASASASIFLRGANSVEFHNCIAISGAATTQTGFGFQGGGASCYNCIAINLNPTPSGTGFSSDLTWIRNCAAFGWSTDFALNIGGTPPRHDYLISGDSTPLGQPNVFINQDPNTIYFDFANLDLRLASQGVNGFNDGYNCGTDPTFGNPDGVPANTGAGGLTPFDVSLVPTRDHGTGDNVWNINPWDEEGGSTGPGAPVIEDITTVGQLEAWVANTNGDRSSANPALYRQDIGRVAAGVYNLTAPLDFTSTGVEIGGSNRRLIANTVATDDYYDPRDDSGVKIVYNGRAINGTEDGLEIEGIGFEATAAIGNTVGMVELTGVSNVVEGCTVLLENGDGIGFILTSDTSEIRTSLAYGNATATAMSTGIQCAGAIRNCVSWNHAVSGISQTTVPPLLRNCISMSVANVQDYSPSVSIVGGTNCMSGDGTAGTGSGNISNADPADEFFDPDNKNFQLRTATSQALNAGEDQSPDYIRDIDRVLWGTFSGSTWHMGIYDTPIVTTVQDINPPHFVLGSPTFYAPSVSRLENSWYEVGLNVYHGQLSNAQTFEWDTDDVRLYLVGVDYNFSSTDTWTQIEPFLTAGTPFSSIPGRNITAGEARASATTISLTADDIDAHVIVAWNDGTVIVPLQFIGDAAGLPVEITNGSTVTVTAPVYIRGISGGSGAMTQINIYET